MIKRETFESNAEECIDIIKKYDKNDYGLFMRIYYITYYYSIVKLNNLKNYMNSNNISFNTLNPVFELLPSISSYMNSEFRSCMMHYKFENPKHKVYLRKKELIDSNKLLESFHRLPSGMMAAQSSFAPHWMQ